MSKRHFVLLGAGASRATLPNGDASGRLLPVFNDLVDVLGLREEIEAAGQYRAHENFEALYSRLIIDGTNQNLVALLEHRVLDYFTELRLPDHPTIYDHLLLSLRPKDLVATFNWDPLLVQAIQRCQSIAAVPHCLHLHGNVATGYCTKHSKLTIGDRGAKCSKCGDYFTDSKLLYPVTKKQYSNDPLLDRSWAIVRDVLPDSFLFSVFGYSAPTTDVEAVALLQDGWGHAEDRSLEEIEIIDIRPEDDVVKSWDSFIHSHHYQVHSSFYESMIAQLPRRSVEMMQRQLLDAEIIEPFPIPRDADWQELRDWATPYRIDEANNSG